MTLNGKKIWEKNLPYTFHRAQITNSGLVAGIAYTKGTWGLGDFVVAVIDPSGKAVIEDRSNRVPSRFLYTDPDPKSQGVVLDTANDRLLVRIAGADLNSGVEMWQVYQLSTRRRLPNVYPEGKERVQGTWVFDVKPVPGTPLLISSWQYIYQGEGMSQRYVLLDYDGKSVWRRDLPNDFEHETRYPKDRFKVRDDAFDNGTVFPGPDPRQFQLRFMRESKMVRFECSNSNGKWSVREVGRKDYKAPAPAPKPKPVSFNPPSAKLVEFGRVVLPRAKETPSVVDSVGEFCVVGDRFAFVYGGRPRELRVVNRSGALLRKVKLPKEAQVSDSQLFLTKSGKSQVILVSTNAEKDNGSEAWRIETSTGVIKPIPMFTASWVKAIAAFDDGRFVVLSTTSETYTMTDHLTLHAADGSRRWDTDDSGGYGGEEHEMISPHDVDVNAKGEIVVLDNTRRSLFFFDTKGKFLRRASFEKSVKRDHMYPTDITALPNNRYLVYDFASENRNLLFLDSTGRFLGEGKPTHTTGKLFGLSVSTQVDNVGNLWVTNASSILRIDAKGRVQETIGKALRTSGLGEIGDLHVMSDGKVYALDIATSAVHAFGSNGKSLFVAMPNPFEFKEDGGMFSPTLTVTQSGDIYVSGSDKGELLHIAPMGKRMGYVPYSAKDRDAKVWPSPPFTAKPTYRWHWDRLVDENGKPVAAMRRWPDQRWMNGPSEIAPDGRMMSFETLPAPQRGRIAFFASNGMPDGMVELPVGFNSVGYRYEAAFDGSRSYFVTMEGLVAIDRKGRALWRYRPKGWNSEWKIFPSRGGLALYDSRQTVIWVKP